MRIRIRDPGMKKSSRKTMPASIYRESGKRSVGTNIIIH